MRKCLTALATLFSLFLYTSCVSMVERTGRALDGSAFAERVQATYGAEGSDLEIRKMRSRDGEYSLIILPKRFPSVQIRASAPDATGGFILVSLDYLGGNEHGWNEFRLDLFGSGSFVQAETSARFSSPQGFEPVQISFGRIRRYDTRITGNEALTYLRNRHERILALTEWMHDQEGHPQGMSLGDFERHWGPILFPELARRRARPQGWLQQGDTRVRAENISWNIGYTERAFPELLWNVRNSGTLLRDWEEALEWIHLKYEWGDLVELLARETVLVRGR